MPQQRSNKSQTPVNSDAFNLVPDLASFSDSLEVIVPVASDSEGDTIATARATAGWPVTDARPLFTYNTTTKTARLKDGSGWRNLVDTNNKPFGHMGKTNAFQSCSGTTKVVFTAAQTLRGGFTFDSTSGCLVVPYTGWYSVRIKGFFTGAANETNQTGIWLNGAAAPNGIYQGPASSQNKNGGGDIFVHSAGTCPFTAGDLVGVWQNTAVSCWGTNGYDGTWIELEWEGPWT